jgi:outer membrane lipoprotein-sorting protein
MLMGVVVGLLAIAAQADDLACKKMLLDVMTKSLQTPSHTYLSMVDTSPAGTTTNSETIFADNKIYVKDATGWEASPLSQQKATEATVSMIRDAKVSACTHVRDETIDGSVAAVYGLHLQNEDSQGDAQMWISKSQGVMLRYEAISAAQQMRVSMRYVYTGVHVPAVTK